MKKPTNQIEADLKYYKYQNNMYCQNCKHYQAHFTYIRVNSSGVHFVLNCSECGEDGQYTLSYEKLLEVYYTKNLKGNFLTLWKIFRLGMYYNIVFQFEHEKQKFVKLVCRLNKDTSGIRDFYYRRKYHAN